MEICNEYQLSTDIRLVREMLPMNQSDLARELRVSSSAIYRLEKGTLAASPNSLKAKHISANSKSTDRDGINEGRRSSGSSEERERMSVRCKYLRWI